MRGLQQMDDYAKFVPGMSLGAAASPAARPSCSAASRASGLQFGAVSSSALYLDEQPITQSGRNPDPRLIDIERIEALRGPQGTLYGASSQSGTLRVITNKPDPGGFESWADAQVSSVSDGDTGYDISAMVNVPIGRDKLALRLVGFTAGTPASSTTCSRDSQGGTFRQCRTSSRRTSTTVDDEWRPRGAALGRHRKRRCDASARSSRT